MTILKKIWAFIKNYWFIPVIAIFGYLFFKKDKLKNIVTVRKNAYEKEKKVIEETKEIKKILKEEETKRHNKEIEKIENKYVIKREELDKKLEKESKENLESPKENIAKKIAEKFEIKYEE